MHFYVRMLSFCPLQPNNLKNLQAKCAFTHLVCKCACFASAERDGAVSSHSISVRRNSNGKTHPQPLDQLLLGIRLKWKRNSNRMHFERTQSVCWAGWAGCTSLKIKTKPEALLGSVWTKNKRIWKLLCEKCISCLHFRHNHTSCRWQTHTHKHRICLWFSIVRLTLGKKKNTVRHKILSETLALWERVRFKRITHKTFHWSPTNANQTPPHHVHFKYESACMSANHQQTQLTQYARGGVTITKLRPTLLSRTARDLISIAHRVGVWIQLRTFASTRCSIFSGACIACLCATNEKQGDCHTHTHTISTLYPLLKQTWNKN